MLFCGQLGILREGSGSRGNQFSTDVFYPGTARVLLNWGANDSDKQLEKLGVMLRLGLGPVDV